MRGPRRGGALLARGIGGGAVVVIALVGGTLLGRSEPAPQPVTWSLSRTPLTAPPAVTHIAPVVIPEITPTAPPSGPGADGNGAAPDLREAALSPHREHRARPPRRPLDLVSDDVLDLDGQPVSATPVSTVSRNNLRE
jgi:hypothetical protein